VAANPRNVIRVETRAFEHLGTISYGFYMFHMIAVYMTSYTFLRWRWWDGRPLAVYIAAYYGLAIGLTILLATLSFRFFERPFLRLMERRFSAEGTQPRPLSHEWERGEKPALP
jgi:peptidoglycan/LPS O-acetylase OafA/YrhL